MHATWTVAVGAGLAVLLLLTGVFSRNTVRGDTALRQPSAGLEAKPSNPREALRALGQADAALGADAILTQRAWFEYLSAAYAGSATPVAPRPRSRGADALS